MLQRCSSFFFFNDTATTEIYTLSYTTLFRSLDPQTVFAETVDRQGIRRLRWGLRYHLDRSSGIVDASFAGDRKSTRLNSSHANISYAVFCLKKKQKNIHTTSAQCSNAVRART